MKAKVVQLGPMPTTDAVIYWNVIALIATIVIALKGYGVIQ